MKKKKSTQNQRGKKRQNRVKPMKGSKKWKRKGEPPRQITGPDGRKKEDPLFSSKQHDVQTNKKRHCKTQSQKKR